MSNPVRILVLYCISSSIFILLPALINGYPLVYSDTSTYLASGFELETPFDRPITYGLFIRFASWGGISLWLVITLQSLLVSYLLLRITHQCIQTRQKSIWMSMGIIGILSFLSSLSWTTCQLMPDLFTSIMCLSSFLLLTEKSSKKERAFLFLLFLVSCSMHMSHVLLSLSLLSVTLLLVKLRVQDFSKQIRLNRIFALLALTLVSILSMGSALSKSRHVFFMGAMVEHGILKKYLDRHCPDSGFQLCLYKDSLPEKAWQFIWEPSSPFYKTGGWKDSKKEYNEIIWGSLTEPYFLIMHLTSSFEATIQQLLHVQIGDGNKSYPFGTMLYDRILKYVPHEHTAYESSLQNKGSLAYVELWNKMLNMFLLLSFVLLVFFLYTNKTMRTRYIKNPLYVWLLGCILLNAWVCGTFANAIDRLGSKMIWLFPFSFLIFLAELIQNKLFEKQSSTIQK